MRHLCFMFLSFFIGHLTLNYTLATDGPDNHGHYHKGKFACISSVQQSNKFEVLADHQDNITLLKKDMSVQNQEFENALERFDSNFPLSPKHLFLLKTNKKSALMKVDPFSSKIFKRILKLNYFEYLNSYRIHFEKSHKSISKIYSEGKHLYLGSLNNLQKFLNTNIVPILFLGNYFESIKTSKSNDLRLFDLGADAINSIETSFQQAYPLSSVEFAKLKKVSSKSVSDYETYIDYLDDYENYLKRKVEHVTSFTKTRTIKNKKGKFYVPSGKKLENLKAFQTNHYPYLPRVEGLPNLDHTTLNKVRIL